MYMEHLHYICLTHTHAPAHNTHVYTPPNNNKQTVRALCDRGCDVNSLDRDMDETPMTTAARENWPKVNTAFDTRVMRRKEMCVC